MRFHTRANAAFAGIMNSGPAIRFIFVLALSLGLLASCSTLRESQNEGAPPPAQLPEKEELRLSDKNVAPQLLRYHQNEERFASPLLVSQTLPTKSETSSSKQIATQEPDESLFSWDYLKSIALDTRETFTAPAHESVIPFQHNPKNSF
jgi:hypothetical protein